MLSCDASFPRRRESIFWYIRKWAPAFAGVTALLLLSSCAETPKTGAEKITLTPAAFSDLAGWSSDKISEAAPALARSCRVIAKKAPDSALGVAGQASDWLSPCADLAANPPQDDAAARAFFERWFRPYAASGNSGSDGLFTGYYEAELHGTAQQSGAYHTPLYARPDDLIDVDLGEFKKDLHGQHIVGKVEGRKLKPYDDRAKITAGSLAHRAQPLLWVDDPVDAFFLEVQGSGRVRMDDGHIMRMGYDGANGRAYVAIGRALADMQLLEKPVTMQSIRGWLKAHPERAKEIMNLNPSYVFFKTIDGEGPIGAEGVALTPQRSMAVDPAFVPLGVPLWLDSVDGHGAILQRLMVAQDTGGAIKGPVRGDVFWGFGADAEAQAGAMQGQGRIYLLLPKAAHVGG